MSRTAARRDEILDSIRVGLLALDGSGRIELVNAEACRILGISADRAGGLLLGEVLGAVHPVAALVEEVRVTAREVLSHDRALRPPLGAGRHDEPVIVDLAASPLRPEQGGGTLVTLSDRTIGRELERVVDERTRTEQFGRLAEGIAHEVRNPLGGIRGAAELLIAKLDDPGLLKYAELVRDETDRVRRLLDDLSQLTRGGALRRRATNLHRVLDDLLALQSRAPEWCDIELAREYDPSIPEISVDPDRVAQIFINLMRNAVSAMEGKGRLLLRTRVANDFQLSAGDGGATRAVQIDVEDSGPGIPEEDLPHLFTPFFTRRAAGTGLGLAVAQHWTVSHGGHIQVSNRDERGRTTGTRVRVLLPLTAEVPNA